MVVGITQHNTTQIRFCNHERGRSKSDLPLICGQVRPRTCTYRAPRPPLVILNYHRTMNVYRSDVFKHYAHPTTLPFVARIRVRLKSKQGCQTCQFCHASSTDTAPSATSDVEWYIPDHWTYETFWNNKLIITYFASIIFLFFATKTKLRLKYTSYHVSFRLKYRRETILSLTMMYPLLLNTLTKVCPLKLCKLTSFV